MAILGTNLFYNLLLFSLTGSVFLALKKVGVRQYKDSDSKPSAGVITQASSRRTPTKDGLNSINSGGMGGGGVLGCPLPWIFFFKKALGDI